MKKAQVFGIAAVGALVLGGAYLLFSSGKKKEPEAKKTEKPPIEPPPGKPKTEPAVPDPQVKKGDRVVMIGDETGERVYKQLYPLLLGRNEVFFVRANTFAEASALAAEKLPPAEIAFVFLGKDDADSGELVPEIAVALFDGLVNEKYKKVFWMLSPISKEEQKKQEKLLSGRHGFYVSTPRFLDEDEVDSLGLPNTAGAAYIAEVLDGYVRAVLDSCLIEKALRSPLPEEREKPMIIDEKYVATEAEARSKVTTEQRYEMLRLKMKPGDSLSPLFNFDEAVPLPRSRGASMLVDGKFYAAFQSTAAAYLAREMFQERWPVAKRGAKIEVIPE